MSRHHLPPLGARFWFAISLVSVLGANLGDLFAHDLGLGHAGGLPFLAVAFGLTLAAERFVSAATEAFYWVALIILRTAATNLGDLATHDGKLDDLTVAAVFAVVVGFCALWGRGSFLEAGKPRTGWLYWLTMLAAGILGTTLGDGSADALSLGVSTLVWLAIWAAAMGLVIGRPAIGAFTYWGVVSVVRTVGTNVGDWMAGRGLHLGLPLSTALALIAFVALLAAWPRERVFEERVALKT